MTGAKPAPAQFLARADLQRLLDALQARGYRVMGPLPQDGAVVFDQIRAVDELPRGLREVQEPGRYRTEANGRDTFFDVVNGPDRSSPMCSRHGSSCSRSSPTAVPSVRRRRSPTPRSSS